MAVERPASGCVHIPLHVFCFPAVEEFGAGVVALAKVLAESKHELGWREAVVLGCVAPVEECFVEFFPVALGLGK